MKIIQIAHANVPILAQTGRCGGLEEVIAILDRHYTKLGHESYIIAPSDSESHGTLLPTIKSLHSSNGEAVKLDPEHIERAFKEHAEITLDYIRIFQPNIIHDHLGTGYHKNISFTRYLFDPAKGLRNQTQIDFESFPPILATIHSPLTDRNRDMYIKFQRLLKNQNVHFNAVSQFQRAIFKEVLDMDYVVLNGIDVDSYGFEPEGKGYVFSMGAIYPGKGTHIAIDTALKLNKKIIIAGPVHDQKYWETLKPKIDKTELDVPADQIKQLAEDFVDARYQVLYVGELGASQKRIFFNGADVFYFPVTIDEAFGLVAAEANASGVPVISFLTGGVPEVIKHGVTGYTVKRGDNEKFMQAASNAHKLSRYDCRRWARQNFEAERQAKDYIDIYKNICSEANALIV